MIRCISAAVFGLLLATVPVSAQSGSAPSCTLIGWLDALQLVVGSDLDAAERQAQVRSLMRGVDMARVMAEISRNLPDTDASNISALLAGARQISGGRRATLDSTHAQQLRQSVSRLNCRGLKPVSYIDGDTVRIASGIKRTLDPSSRNRAEIGKRKPLLYRPGVMFAVTSASILAFVADALRRVIRNERQSRRYVCVLRVTVEAGAELVPARLLDISRGGCRISLTGQLQEGQTVIVRGYALHAPARIAWTGGNVAGLAFLTPLMAEQVSELVELSQKPAMSASASHDTTKKA